MERIDSRVEEPTRELLGHALRAEGDDLAHVLDQVVSEGLLSRVTRLTAQVAAVVCIDLSKGQVPTADNLREVAETTERIDVDYNLNAHQVNDYLARVVFGGETPDVVFGADDAVFLQFAITSNLLASTAGLVDGRDWLAYLDAVENAIESSSATERS